MCVAFLVSRYRSARISVPVLTSPSRHAFLAARSLASRLSPFAAPHTPGELDSASRKTPQGNPTFKQFIVPTSFAAAWHRPDQLARRYVPSTPRFWQAAL